MDPIRVVIADDHDVLRVGIRTLLSRSDDIDVVAEASDGMEALQRVEEWHPDVLLLDMEMPVLDGVEVAKQLRAQNSPVRILVLSAYNDKQYILSMLEQGVAGYLIKDEAPNNIIQAVRAVAQGEQGWFSRKVTARLQGDGKLENPTEGQKDTKDQGGVKENE